ncbi:MAG TPA: endonuclease/exonuclease/phosphatase family protein [Patescibacteria group bacterium]|nr:endonuclease/exonuclease/phosphatase family protein [Patescibacteria group bacterium]
MRFSVLFWNIWLDNQINGRRNAQRLLAELNNIVEKYQPDCIGLNEVLQGAEESSPFVLENLETVGYRHNHFAPSSPVDKNWVIGTAVSSKHPLLSPTIISLGKDKFAESEGFPGHTLKAVATKVMLPQGKTIGFVAAHPVHLRPTFLGHHYKHTKALTNFLRTPDFSEDTILGGDFNEPRFMPNSFRQINRNHFNHKSGPLWSPTWRHRASKITPIRANLDKLFWTKKGSIQLLKFKVIPTDVSDHRPIFAIFGY